MSYSILCLYAVGIFGLLSGLIVASSLNAVYRTAFLILVFLSGSFYMMILDFYFLGLTYIIVYVGAIMILFLFVIMMVQIHLMPVTLSVSPTVYTDSLATPGAITNGGYEASLNLEQATQSNNGMGPLGSLTDLALTCGGITTLVSMYNPAHIAENEQTPLGVTASSNMHTTDTGVNQMGNRSPLSLPFVFILCLITGFVLLWIVFGFTDSINEGKVVNYFFPSWFVEFRSMSDLETLANILYLGYPLALILIGVALWVVLIGIIKVTMSDKMPASSAGSHIVN